MKNIHWLGHDTFRIEAENNIIYFDPYQLQSGLPKADLIFITHDHFDHCSPEDVEKLIKKDTVIVTIKAAADKLSGEIVVVKPGDKLKIKNIPVEVVPAYNINKFREPGVVFHPKSVGHVGFIITVNNERIYHAGDTDFIPEMKNLRVDIALLPISGTYVMTVDEAVEAAKVIHPKTVIPMHVGRGIGNLDMLKEFNQKSSIPVTILELTHK